jgi:hypothetical protein
MAFDLRPGFRYSFGDIWVRWVKQTAAGPKLGFNIRFQFTEAPGLAHQ